MNTHLRLAAGLTWRQAFEAANETISFAHWYIKTRDAIPEGPLRFDPRTGILEVDGFGAFLTIKEGIVSVSLPTTSFGLRAGHKTKAIHFLHPASLSTPAVFALLSQGVELVVWHWQSPVMAAAFEVCTHSDVRPAAVRMRLRALECASGRQGFEVAQAIVTEKLKRFEAAKEWRETIRTAKTSRELMLIEAKGTREFWLKLGVQRSRDFLTTSIGAMTRQAARARKTVTKRGATDPMNAAINYTNAVAASAVLKQLVAVGLDPAIGFLHKRGPRPLVYDCLELLRADIAEKVVKHMQERTSEKSLLSAKTRRDLSRIAVACDAREAVGWVIGRIKTK